jgi:hypothetical protein
MIPKVSPREGWKWESDEFIVLDDLASLSDNGDRHLSTRVPVPSMGEQAVISSFDQGRGPEVRGLMEPLKGTMQLGVFSPPYDCPGYR